MVYENLALQCRVPDLVIYLQAPSEVLRERVSRRGIAYEQRIEDAYLKRLADGYADFFHYYEDAPLLIVNASAIDLVNSDEDYEQLLSQIGTLNAGRNYYNPLSTKGNK